MDYATHKTVIAGDQEFEAAPDAAWTECVERYASYLDELRHALSSGYRPAPDDKPRLPPGPVPAHLAGELLLLAAETARLLESPPVTRHGFLGAAQAVSNWARSRRAHRVDALN